MEKEDKIFEQFKSAAENAEAKDFPAMDKVWNRIEDKLDNKKDKKAMLLWKKIAVAASLLLVTTLGYQFFKNNPNQIKPSEITVSADSTKTKTPNANAVVTLESTNPAIKTNAEQILQKQIKPSTQVAVSEGTKADDNLASPNSISTVTQGYFKSPTVAKTEEYKSESKKEKTKDVEVFIDKKNQVSNDKMEEPLVVIDNKVEKKNIKDIEFDEADSLVVLKEPLYIINGVEYTEKEMFGQNPTSPYAPLKKQEIETLSILQDEKAIELYGNKGKKGVVIITTKNGKPKTASLIPASKKAK